MDNTSSRCAHLELSVGICRRNETLLLLAKGRLDAIERLTDFTCSISIDLQHLQFDFGDAPGPLSDDTTSEPVFDLLRERRGLRYVILTLS